LRLNTIYNTYNSAVTTIIGKLLKVMQKVSENLGNLVLQYDSLPQFVSVKFYFVIGKGITGCHEAEAYMLQM
jgi:hypothetical protein